MGDSRAIRNLKVLRALFRAVAQKSEVEVCRIDIGLDVVSVIRQHLSRREGGDGWETLLVKLVGLILRWVSLVLN